MTRPWLVLLMGILLAGCTATGRDPAVYQSLSEEDVRSAAATVQAALEQAPDGVSRVWRNPQTGHRGSVTPIRTFIGSDGRFCREYREVLDLREAKGSFLHTACRDQEAGWRWL